MAPDVGVYVSKSQDSVYVGSKTVHEANTSCYCEACEVFGVIYRLNESMLYNNLHKWSLAIGKRD